MASASSSAAKRLIRDGKTAASLLFRGRTANLTESVQKNTGQAIRSMLRFNQTPGIQYPVFSEAFPVKQSGLGVGFVHKEAVSERMEAGNGKRVVDNDSEEETDYDDYEGESDGLDDFDEFEDMDEDVDDDEEDEDKYTRKKK